VKEQVQHLDTEMCTLDTVFGHIQEQNNTVHTTRERSLSTLASTVQDSYGNLSGTFTASFARLGAFNNDIVQQTNRMHEQVLYLNRQAPIRSQLAELSGRVEYDKLDEYMHTGQTPTRREYSYAIAVPRTNNRDIPTDCMQPSGPGAEPTPCSKPTNIPSKALVFSDNSCNTGPESERAGSVMPGTAAHPASLRERDVNTLRNAKTQSSVAGLQDIALSEKNSIKDGALAPSSLKRLASTSEEESRGSSKKARRHNTTVATGLLTADSATLADRENLSMPKLSAKAGLSAVSSLGRRLRSCDRSK
jgi:hypothetical protein